MKCCGDKLLASHRQFAKITDFKQAEGKNFWVCELANFTDFVFEKCADHAAKIKEVAEAAAAAAAAAKDAPEEKPAEDAKPEAEAADPPPAEGA